MKNLISNERGTTVLFSKLLSLDFSAQLILAKQTEALFTSTLTLLIIFYKVSAFRIPGLYFIIFSSRPIYRFCFLL